MGKKNNLKISILIMGILAAALISCESEPQRAPINLSVLDSDIIQITPQESKTDAPAIDVPAEDEKAEIPESAADKKPEKTEPKDAAKDAAKDLEIPEEYKHIKVRRTAIEGELIQLNPEAVDYDGDEITYSFSKPFDKSGSWQTKDGDAGFYKIKVSASDGKDTTTQDALIIVLSSNKPPVLKCPEKITIKETELLVIDCEAYDPEGDAIIMEYSGWASQRTKATGYDHAGTHKVYVTASDGEKSTKAEITVIVEDKNRPPVVEPIDDIRVTEGDLVKVVPSVSDPDKDPVTITFKEPLNAKGEWQTQAGDSGQYESVILFSDGKDTVEKKVKIHVSSRNRPPVLERINDIVVDEGDTIRILAVAHDPDGDHVTIKVSGWMNSLEYTTTYTDSGEYVVKVTASDGELETSQDVHITVNDVNRPPVFRVPI